MTRQTRRARERRERGSPEPRPSKRRAWILLGGGGLAVIVAVVAIVVAVLSGSGEAVPEAAAPAVDSGGHSRGSPDAPVVFVEFGDFQ